MACRTSTDGGAASIEMMPTQEAPQAPSPKKVSLEIQGDIVVNDIPPTSIGELARPVYPPEALAAHAGRCVIYATITIDAPGAVTEVLTSWQRLNIPNRYSDQFLEAAKAGVRKWKFEPARLVYYQKVGGDDLKYLRAEAVPSRTDVKFTFEESGTVR